MREKITLSKLAREKITLSKFTKIVQKING